MSCNVILAILPAGCAISAAAGQAGSSMIDSIAAELASVMKSLMTFWIKAPDPDLSSGPGSVIAQVQAITGPIIAFAVIVGIIVAAMKMIRASSDVDSSMNELTRGLLLMVSVSVAGASVVELLESGFSQLAQYILDKGFNGHDVGQTIVKLFSDPTGGGGVSAVIFGVLGIIASAIQYGIMVLRGAILALLVGILPIAAAGALTDGGMQSFKKVCGWISAFVIYRVAAAVIYATAFLMLGSGSSSGILFGLLLVVLSILALPALLRLMPAGAEAMGGGGGSALGAIAGAAATGSLLLAGGGSKGAAAAMSPTGSQTPGLKSPAGYGGGPGRSGGSRSPGSGGPGAGGSGSPSGGPTTGGPAVRPALVGAGGSGGSSGGTGAAGTSAGTGATAQSGSGSPTSGTGGGSGQSGASGGSPSSGGSGRNGAGGTNGSPGTSGATGQSAGPGNSGQSGLGGASAAPASGGTTGSPASGSRGGNRFDQAMRAVQVGQAAKGAGDAASGAATGTEPKGNA